jgi:hypothetical protein
VLPLTLKWRRPANWFLRTSRHEDGTQITELPVKRQTGYPNRDPDGWIRLTEPHRSPDAAELAVGDRQPSAGVLARFWRCRSALSECILFEDERRFGWLSSLWVKGCGTTANVVWTPPAQPRCVTSLGCV